MAFPRWARRIGIGQGGSMDPTETGFYATADQLAIAELRKLHVYWIRNGGTGTGEDQAMTTMHFLNTTAEQPDDTWTEADFAAIEARLDTWWTALKTFFNQETVLAEYRWYRAAAG